MNTEYSKIIGITDGSSGMVAQVVALAEAMGFTPQMQKISLPKWLRLIPNGLYDIFPFLLCFIKPPVANKNQAELVISCGRKAAAVSAAIKKISPDIKTIHIQDPQMSARNFDAVVAMQHDKISGQNVIKTTFALHSITPEKLSAARSRFLPIFSHYPRPHIAVLLGGNTNKYQLTEKRMEKLISDLKDKLASMNGSLLITTSRRTGTQNTEALKSAFANDSRVYIYDGNQENPYMGLLATADKIMVSNDSVNMMSEALATGKDVDILLLADHNNTKPSRFADKITHGLRMKGNEMQQVAASLNKILSNSQSITV